MQKTNKGRITWTADIKLRAVGGEAVVSLDPTARSLARPLNGQDFWLGWPLPGKTERTLSLTLRPKAPCSQEQVSKHQSQRFSNVLKAYDKSCLQMCSRDPGQLIQ